MDLPCKSLTRSLLTHIAFSCHLRYLAEKADISSPSVVTSSNTLEARNSSGTFINGMPAPIPDYVVLRIEEECTNACPDQTYCDKESYSVANFNECIPVIQPW